MSLTSPWHRLHELLQLVTLHPFGPLFISGCYFHLVHSGGWSWRYLLPLCCSCSLSVANISAAENTNWWLVAYQPHWNFLTSASALAVPGALVVAIHCMFLTFALRLWHLPASPVWYWLGGLTYPLYLLHSEISVQLWQVLPLPEWTRVALMLPLAIVLAANVARFSERRLTRLVHAWLSAGVRRLRSLTTGPGIR